MNLTDLKDGEIAIIDFIDAGIKAKKRLSDLGIITGKEIKIKRNSLFKGPIEIEISGSRLILGYGLSEKIKIK